MVSEKVASEGKIFYAGEIGANPLKAPGFYAIAAVSNRQFVLKSPLIPSAAAAYGFLAATDGSPGH